jgi:hypothetical protein
MEVRPARDYKRFEDFVDELSHPEITDRVFRTAHSRWTWSRMVRYANAGKTFECEHSPVSEGIRYATVNEVPLRRPQLDVRGFDLARLRMPPGQPTFGARER